MGLKVILLKFNLPSGGMGSYFLWLTPIHEVLMISPDDNRLIGRSGAEQVGPMAEGTDDGEEFLVVDLVVHFYRGQGLGIIADGFDTFWGPCEWIILFQKGCEGPCNSGEVQDKGVLVTEHTQYFL
jgi:hypothetical protein